MSSVTARAKGVKQPYGGYLKPSLMDKRNMADEDILAEVENVHASIVGMVVDYLTRVMMGTPVEKAFQISLAGAEIAERLGCEQAIEEADLYLMGIHGLNDESVVNACKLATFDVWRRAPMDAFNAKTAADTNPDADTVSNIRIMVTRNLRFWQEYGPITEEGFTFGPSGYSDVVNSGDGDYLTADTLWDFKVSKLKPKSTQTLQLLMYWIMGQHSGKLEFKGINKVGFFNPRLNLVFTYEMEKIPRSTIEEIERNVICYK